MYGVASLQLYSLCNLTLTTSSGCSRAVEMAPAPSPAIAWSTALLPETLIVLISYQLR